MKLEWQLCAHVPGFQIILQVKKIFPSLFHILFLTFWHWVPRFYSLLIHVLQEGWEGYRRQKGQMFLRPPPTPPWLTLQSPRNEGQLLCTGISSDSTSPQALGKRQHVMVLRAQALFSQRVGLIAEFLMCKETYAICPTATATSLVPWE